MKHKHLTIPAALSAMMVAIYSCAPSTGSSTRTTIGTITGFGSVFVNGIEYDTTGTRIEIEDGVGSEAELESGMKVVVKGTDDGTKGKATSIQYDAEIEGVVESNGIGAGQTTGTMTIMGQTVTITDKTIIEISKTVTLAVPAVTSIDLVTPGMILEISGYSDGNGNVIATYVEVEAPDQTTYQQMHPEGMEMEGTISGLNTTNSTFTIGGLTINYATADLQNMPSTGIADGLYVEVSTLSPIQAKGVLVATVIEVEGDGDMEYDGTPGESIYLEGTITGGIGAGNTFDLNGQTIIVDDNTAFEGIDKAGLIVGVDIEVDGVFNDNGAIVAKEVGDEQEATGSVSGIVTAVNATGPSSGTVTIGTTVIHVNTNTRLSDDFAVEGVKFNLEQLQQDQFVIIAYYIDGTTQNNIATDLERSDEI